MKRLSDLIKETRNYRGAFARFDGNDDVVQHQERVPAAMRTAMLGDGNPIQSTAHTISDKELQSGEIIECLTASANRISSLPYLEGSGR
ncbi:Acyl-CoA reductase or other NAD-dependent aldehyde dehydrogenase [Pseudomonas syringae pv. actinidiae]|uniref:Acyl-CoA reductase or other NAD-dependent aldehyde dehydrogenase n=1 Tax=Pseudomonas syringae pv. actinidiae TaxID=103796 RepID=A0A2V0QKV6_PSESF|nr:Acyl-CoA reductase or other NAD-dependent aldehyde dehydrogenase [Pseudomonas syringae pv. actinidiae]